MHFFSCHLKIVILKLEKVQKRVVRVMELILCRAQLSTLDLFKKEVQGISHGKWREDREKEYKMN